MRATRLILVGLGSLILAPATSRAEDTPPVHAVAPPPSDEERKAAALKARIETLEKTVAAQSALLDASLASQIDDTLGALAAGDQEQRPGAISVYGFMDMGLQRYLSPDPLVKGLVGSSETTFISGNNNLYFDARPRPQWRALLETRFSLHPHGNVTVGGIGPARRQDTSLIDSTSASGRSIVRLGSIIIERAVLEWHYDARLTIQTGYFLTPWGIWNIDHGTPTLISLLMPSFLLNEAILRQQTGVHAFGRFTRDDLTLGYSAYVSNGRTASQFDLTDDKALGGRLSASRFGSVRPTLGISVFHGTSEDEQRAVVVDAGGNLGIDITQTIGRQETSFGADLSVDWKGLRVRTEAVIRRVTHDPGLYPRVLVNPAATEPNRTEIYGYALAAYRFNLIEPLVYVEYIDANKRTDLIDRGHAFSLGVNIYLSQVAQIKTQYVLSVLDSVYGDNVSLGFFSSRFVLSF
ncbi:MAG: hypothetical protein KA712_22040 [Myxococcales bacterium]|nr:hypothetical protein [Myxococcales bacterium]